MRYSLMHKDTVVSDLDIDEDSGTVSKILSVQRVDHMPVGTAVDGKLDASLFKEWWSGRSIPASRSGIREFLDALNIANAKILLTKSFGLSLSDQYWIRPDDSDINWGDVNFFDNDFSDDIGNLLFGKEIEHGVIDLS